jgi:hypothetical protein
MAFIRVVQGEWFNTNKVERREVQNPTSLITV